MFRPLAIHRVSYYYNLVSIFIELRGLLKRERQRKSEKKEEPLDKIGNLISQLGSRITLMSDHFTSRNTVTIFHDILKNSRAYSPLETIL